jgi:hypothetical protein
MRIHFILGRHISDRRCKMQNIMETIKSLVDEHFIDEPNIPLHTGEVMNIWTFYSFVDEAKRTSVLALNHTTDNELSHLLEDVIYNLEDKQLMKLKEFMKTNGVPMPDVSAEKTISDPEAVPLGAKFTDKEIANALVLKLSAGMLFCSRGISEAIRDDVGLMFTEFHTQKIIYALKVKKVMQKRGWLLVPPYYYAPGIPIQTQ